MSVRRRLRFALRLGLRRLQRMGEQRPQLVLVVWLLVVLLVVIHGRFRHLRAVQADERDAALFARALCRQFKCEQNAINVEAAGVGVVQYVETKMNGFGAQFLRRIDALALARVLGREFSIATRRYWNHGCAPWEGWGCYFIGRFVADERGECTELADWSPFTRTNKPACLRVSTGRSMARAAAVLRASSSGSAGMSRAIASELWDLNDKTRSDVATALGDMGLPLNYIGVHVRRGDKVSEVRPVPLEMYARAVDCVSQPGMAVFIASDDGDCAVRLGKMLSRRQRDVYYARGVTNRRGHSQLLFNQRYMRRNRPHVTALLADMTALSQAYMFIGTLSSNLARTVHMLRKQATNTTFSLDDRWEPGTAWRSFGTRFCTPHESTAATRGFCRCMDSVS